MKTSLCFYHLLPKNRNQTYPGIVSLWWMYNNDRSAFRLNSEKYRDRLCNGWGIYPNREPDSLEDEEVLTGINRFRKSVYGANQIYMFRFPPSKSLGPNMCAVLDRKDIFRIDLFSDASRQAIRKIDFGYNGSFTGNRKLSLKYYQTISEKEYFHDYRDDTKGLLFAQLNHISVVPKGGYIPWECWDLL